MRLISLLFDDLFSNYGYNSRLSYPADNDANWNKTVETSENDTHSIKKEVWVSKDGKSRMERTYSELRSPQLSVDTMREQMKLAIENEDFEKAAQIRDKIKLLNS